MGNCCGLKSDYGDLGVSIGGTKNKDLIKIAEFDWNKDNKGSVTVQEYIMRIITNDAAESVTPQVTHIVFSEFLKFMFLNKQYVDAKRKSMPKKDNNGKEIAPSKYIVGLHAPYVIDIVWSTLISLGPFTSKYPLLKPYFYLLI